MITPKKTLYKWFSNFMKPAQEHFRALIDSFYHKNEPIPMSSIDGLSKAIEDTVSAKQLLNHLKDTNAHRKLFDKKVDKEDGKGLSANDFTNEHKDKLEGLQPTDTSGLLPKGGYDGTGQQLKEAIDGLQTKMQKVETTLSVDDTDFDTLQEIATQVKNNKNLETLLTGKVNKEEGKGLSSNDFTNELKQKLEKIGLFEEKTGAYNLGNGDEVKKYYLTNSDGDIDVTALPINSAVEIYNFSDSVKKIKVGGKFFGDLPFVGKKGSKVLLKKLNDGTLFIEQFNKKMFFEAFPKPELSHYRRVEFNKTENITININRNNGYAYCYIAIPIEGVKSESIISFSFDKELSTVGSTYSLAFYHSQLTSIAFSSSIDGSEDMFGCVLNTPLREIGKVEVPIPIDSTYNINYALLCYELSGMPENFETGDGSVNLVFNKPTVVVKN